MSELIPGFFFGTPWALALLLLLPAWWIARRSRRPAAIVYSRTDALARLPRAGRIMTALLFLLRNLLIAGLIVALARPRTGAREEPVTTEGINIVLAIDLSSSMLSEDFQPQNRMEVAKDKVKQFIMGRRSDRIGLVAFASEALTQVPLTVDYPVLLAAVDNLQAGQLEDGTAIGTAIATATNRLREAPGRSKVLISSPTVRTIAARSIRAPRRRRPRRWAYASTRSASARRAWRRIRWGAGSWASATSTAPWRSMRTC